MVVSLKKMVYIAGYIKKVGKWVPLYCTIGVIWGEGILVTGAFSPV